MATKFDIKKFFEEKHFGFQRIKMEVILLKQTYA